MTLIESLLKAYLQGFSDGFGSNMLGSKTFEKTRFFDFLQKNHHDSWMLFQYSYPTEKEQYEWIEDHIGHFISGR